MYEYCVRDFLQNLFKIVGINSEVSFTRSIMVNAEENVQVLLQAAQVLPQDYLVRKILETLGDGDKTDEILAMLDADEFRRMTEDEAGSGTD